jgi:tRNA A-37 threonylcarbamoyl transferase component Bud32
MIDQVPLDLPPPGLLREAIIRALAEPPERVRPVIGPDGARYWLKRTETLSLRLRLQKGESTKGFEADRQGLHVLGRAGLPVVPIVAEGPDFLVMPDCGESLQTVLRHADTSAEERLAAFSAAGKALAALHLAGFCHGRPSIRDILWDGSKVTFIDLERFDPQRTGVDAFATDLMIFIHSVFAVRDRAVADLDAAIAGYRANGPAGAWTALRRKARRLEWLIPLSAPLRWLRPASRDLNAVPQTLRYLARQD